MWGPNSWGIQSFKKIAKGEIQQIARTRNRNNYVFGMKHHCDMNCIGDAI